MLQITEVNIFSLSREDGVCSVEGEIVFEDDLTSAFEATYLEDEDELEDVSLEMDFDQFDQKVWKEMLLDAISNYEE